MRFSIHLGPHSAVTSQGGVIALPASKTSDEGQLFSDQMQACSSVQDDSTAVKRDGKATEAVLVAEHDLSVEGLKLSTEESPAASSPEGQKQRIAGEDQPDSERSLFRIATQINTATKSIASRSSSAVTSRLLHPENKRSKKKESLVETPEVGLNDLTSQSNTSGNTSAAQPNTPQIASDVPGATGNDSTLSTTASLVRKQVAQVIGGKQKQVQGVSETLRQGENVSHADEQVSHAEKKRLHEENTNETVAGPSDYHSLDAASFVPQDSTGSIDLLVEKSVPANHQLTHSVANDVVQADQTVSATGHNAFEVLDSTPLSIAAERSMIQSNPQIELVLPETSHGSVHLLAAMDGAGAIHLKATVSGSEAHTAWNSELPHLHQYLESEHVRVDFLEVEPRSEGFAPASEMSKTDLTSSSQSFQQQSHPESQQRSQQQMAESGRQSSTGQLFVNRTQYDDSQPFTPAGRHSIRFHHGWINLHV